MKTKVNILACTLFIILILFCAACKKADNNQMASNSAVIKINGVKTTMDSAYGKLINTGNDTITVIEVASKPNQQPGSYCKIGLRFAPSNQNYKSGTTIDFSTSHAVFVISFNGQNGQNYIEPMPPAIYGSGIITISKNDPGHKRIEGSINSCIISDGIDSPLAIDGNSAVTYQTP